jgi:hypothetical protein
MNNYTPSAFERISKPELIEIYRDRNIKYQNLLLFLIGKIKNKCKILGSIFINANEFINVSEFIINLENDINAKIHNVLEKVSYIETVKLYQSKEVELSKNLNIINKIINKCPNFQTKHTEYIERMSAFLQHDPSKIYVRKPILPANLEPSLPAPAPSAPTARQLQQMYNRQLAEQAQRNNHTVHPAPSAPPALTSQQLQRMYNRQLAEQAQRNNHTVHPAPSAPPALTSQQLQPSLYLPPQNLFNNVEPTSDIVVPPPEPFAGGSHKKNRHKLKKLKRTKKTKRTKKLKKY